MGRNWIGKKPGGGRGKGGVSCNWGSHEGGHVERKEWAGENNATAINGVVRGGEAVTV